MNPSDPSSSTRYVEHPARRRAWRAGQRNLAWGAAFLFAALSVLGIAFFLGGPRAIAAPALCLLAFTALWVLARMKIFGQRNGVFFALAVVAMIGAGAALVEQAWLNLGPRFATEVATQPNVTLNEAEPLPPVLSAPELPFLVDALKLETPEPTLPRVRAMRDLTTTIGGKSYRIRKGETFLLSDEKAGRYEISAGEFIARVPVEAMDQLAPEPVKKSGPAASPKPAPIENRAATDPEFAQTLAKSQKEAARRFPGLAIKGSTENKIFLDAYNHLKTTGSEMLDDPNWPVLLAEMLGPRYGWEDLDEKDPAPETVEPTIAPGTKMLAEPTGDDDALIPPPPRSPQ